MAKATQEQFQARSSVLYTGFFLNGMAIVLTGALLPRLSQLNHMDDRQAGLLLATQSFGNFLGAFLVSNRPLRSLVLGTGFTFAGLLFAGFVAAGGSPLWTIYPGFLLFGFGLGATATATNLIVGARGPAVRARHLSAINFLWSVGAITSPILIAVLITHLTVRSILLLFSLAFLLLLPALLRRVSRPIDNNESTSATILPEPNPSAAVIYFAVLFFLYGGTEMSLSGWLASYAQRFAGATATSNPLAPAAFWTGITAGRAAGSFFLHRIRESHALMLSSSLCMIALVTLLLSSSTGMVLVLAGAAGFFLGPFFPATVSAAIGTGLPSRRLGPLLALCGLGASTLPFLVGVTSAATASLRTGLMLPILYCALMFITIALYRPRLTVGAPLPHNTLA